MATILVIDDQPINREFLAVLLRYGGHEVREAADAAAGLEAMRARRPDLVISDISMPAMDGVEFVRQVRADPVLAPIPVILYTAAYRQAELPLPAGPTTVLRKPSEPQLILDAVAKALAAAADRAPACAPREPPLAARLCAEHGESLRLATLLELSLALAREREPERLLDLAARAAEEVVGARQVAVGIHGIRSGLERFAARGLPEGARTALPDSGAGVLGAMLRGHPAWRVGQRGALSGLPEWSPPGAAVLVVPIRSAARSCGWLYLGEPRHGGAFSDADEQLATVLAAQVALAYENLTLYDTLQKYAARLEFDSAERFHQVFHHAPVGMAIAGLDGRLQRVNPSLCRMLGYAEPELRARTLAELTHPDEQALERPFFERLVAGKIGTYELEKRAFHKAGHPLWLQATAALVRDASGAPSYVITQVQDVTERRRAEAEREQHRSRIAELSRRLVTAQEDERRQLAREVHDVVSPNLAAVQIHLDVLRREAAWNSQELLYRLEDTGALVRDTAHVLRDICFKLRPAGLDYVGLFAALEDYAQQFARRTGIAVQLEGAPLSERLPHDTESLLFRIALEALTNCAKHACARRVTICLSGEAGRCRLTVADDGVGFDPGRIGQDGRPRGQGLLSMGERAEFAGGRFILESAPGQGTRITVEVQERPAE